MKEALEMWVVYDHPKDLPDGYAARKFIIDGLEPTPTDVVMWSDSLDEVRDFLANLGLTPLARHPSDDPVVLEQWL